MLRCYEADEARPNLSSLSFVQTLQSKETTNWTRHPPLRFLGTFFELSKKSWLLAILFPDRAETAGRDERMGSAGAQTKGYDL